MYYRTQEKQNYLKKNNQPNLNQPVTLHLNGIEITDKQQVCHKCDTFHSNWTCSLF